MNIKQIILVAVLFDFSILTGYALLEYGPLGFAQLMIANAVAIQVTVDLVIALSIFAYWMIGDARERGLFVPGYVALILCLGSIGALVYLIRRESVGVQYAAPQPALG